MVAKAASKKLGVLFRLREFFSSSQLLQLYKGLIRPCMEYCSHIWGGSGFTRLLDRVESKAKRLLTLPLFLILLILYPCDVMLVPCHFSIGTTAANARGNYPPVYLHLYDVLAAQGVQCPRINFAWTLATPGLSAVVPLSFLPPLSCGTLFHLLYFPLHLISISLKPASAPT